MNNEVPQAEKDAAAAGVREKSEQTARMGQALYPSERMLADAHLKALEHRNIGNGVSLADRLGWNAEQRAADAAELTAIATATGMNLHEFVELEAAERGLVLTRTAAGQPARDEALHAQRLAQVRAGLHFRYGRKSEDLLARADAFIASHPALAKRLDHGMLRSEKAVIESIVAHVVRTNYGVTPASAKDATITTRNTVLGR